MEILFHRNPIMTRVAIAQIQSSTEKRANLRAARDWIAQARSRGAALIAFPEFLMAFSPASQSAEELAQMAETSDGPFVSSLRETAPAANRVYDSAVWIDGQGNLASIYRKLHLYDAFGFKESDKFHPGAEASATIAAGDLRFGLMICYDLRFPELARLLALGGANVLAA